MAGFIWIDYEQLWIDLIGYIYPRIFIFIFSLLDINFLTSFMISLFLFCFFFLFLAVHVSRLRRAWNLMGTLVRNGLRFFPLLGKKTILYRSQVFLINFLETFSNFRSNRLNNATVCETPMLKKYFNSWKKYFLASNFIENQISIISALFPYFSVFSLPKLN